MHSYLTEFSRECAQQPVAGADEKFIGWEDLIFALVGYGLSAALPELREWLRLGATATAVYRLKIKKKLIDYARENELDFPAAEKAADTVVDNITEENAGKLIDALKDKD